MKQSPNSRSNTLQAIKNFWFACQLLIVSVSLPVMCFLQMSYKSIPAEIKQNDKVVSSQLHQDQTRDLLDAKTVSLK
jgi:hypothetical protein